MELSENLFRRVELQASKTEHLDVKPYSFWKSVLREFVKSKVVIACTIILLVLLFFVVFGTMIFSYSGKGIHPLGPNAVPGPTAWFGVDQANRDVWTEVWGGSQTSLLLAVVVSVINLVVGIIMGSIWGYFRKTDLFFITIREIYYNLPSILIYAVLIMALPFRGFWMYVLAFCALGWLGLASVFRNLILIYSNREYNIASRTLGSKSWTIIINNILPYLLSIIVYYGSAMIPGTVAMEVNLTYFGFGFKSPTKSLGVALEVGYRSDFPYYWHIIFFPAFVIAILTVTLYYIGIKLADATDPRTHR